MENPDSKNPAPGNLPKFDQELVFGVLRSQARRKLLVALVCGGPQTGADLREAGKGKTKSRRPRRLTNGTLVHLKKMVESGIVLKTDHGSDGRRVLYSVSPLVKVTRYGADTEFDFGFVRMRLSAEGN